MILIDTSLWIPFFATKSSHAGEYIEQALRRHESVCINSVIEMEILQGIREDAKFQTIKAYLVDFQYYPELGKTYYDAAVEIYRTCRKNGLTIRRSMDCLIAANALIDNLQVAHFDRDFEMIRSVYPRMKTINITTKSNY
jgi:predicted nucleic acid-binding protein